MPTLQQLAASRPGARGQLRMRLLSTRRPARDDDARRVVHVSKALILAASPLPFNTV
jgi:hypothetical protein